MPVVLALRQWGEDWGTGPRILCWSTGATGTAGSPDLRASRKTASVLKLGDLIWVRRDPRGKSRSQGRQAA